MEKIATPSGATDGNIETPLYRQDGAFVFHHPPKFMWERDLVPNRQMWDEYSVYLHVPFCRRICTYCTFERKQLRRGSIRKFLDLLWVEMDLIQQSDDFTGAKVRSVYLGGGTASLLPNDAIAHFLERLRAEFGLREPVEVTLECEPGTKKAKDFQQLADVGVNRVSIGVQAFHDRLLEGLNRSHSVHHSLEMIQAVREAGIENLHIDLMYGLPGQTIKDWRETVTRTAALDLQHVSMYPLIVFPNELLDREILHGNIPKTPTTQEINDMHLYASDVFTAAGLERYSLTEYCKPGFQCKYVKTTWDGSDYLGMGPGAYSRNHLALWENAVVHLSYERKLKNSSRPIGKSILMSPRECLERDIAMGLCLLKVDIPTIESRAGASVTEEFNHEIRELEADQLVQRTNGKIMLTERGIRYATHVMKTFAA